MTQLIFIHPTHPQSRLIVQSVSVINRGGVLVYPTDSGYAIGCRVGEKAALEKIRQLRGLNKRHHFSLLCHNLSQISLYAQVDNVSFRLLKACTPGPYTFILTATKEVPKRLLHSKRKTVGLRIPDNPVLQAILRVLDAPLMSVSLLLSTEHQQPLAEIEDIKELLRNSVDLIIDSGFCLTEPTSVIDLTCRPPQVLRVGQGDLTNFS